MILFKKSGQLTEYLKKSKANGNKTGFVPTMGALHQGHLSLLETCKKENTTTVCSIFVNPTQFNDPRDFQKYPVTVEQDIEQLEHSGTEILFLPDMAEVYTNGVTQLKPYDLGALENSFEGKFRPGHFQGVCQVMHRLLDIVQPDNLYMGQKDYQQCMVVKRLLELIASKAILHTCPTLREPDGLAMSSRNMRLNETERVNAVAIFKSMQFIRENIEPGCLESLIGNAGHILSKAGFKADYLAITDAATLEPALQWDGARQLIVLVAAFMNDIRLIDNMIITSADARH